MPIKNKASIQPREPRTAGRETLVDELPMPDALRLQEIITQEISRRFSDTLVEQILAGRYIGAGVISAGCNECASGCHGSCKGGCDGSCKGGCGETCKGDCAGTCKGDCSGAAKSGSAFPEDYLSDYLTRTTVQVAATFRNVLVQQGFPR